MSHKVDLLGGIIHNQKFTHLVAGKLSRGEKCLQAIASGCFVLHPSYITKCEEEGRFVAEEAFEYGNPKFNQALDKDTEFSLFNAPFKWRKWLAEFPEKFPKGAFSGLKFIAAVAKEKLNIFVSIVEAGGGKYVPVDSMKAPLDVAFLKSEEVNFCFFQELFISNSNRELLKKQNIEMVSYNFLNDYLIKSTEVPTLLKASK